jgi:hypothetical protein
MESDMKTLTLVSSLLLLSILLSACQAARAATLNAPQEQVITVTEETTATPDVAPLLPQPGQGSMKGFELYSWSENGTWVFAVLVGTNREKTLAEIQAARLAGLNALQPVLEAIPVGEYVTWLASADLPLPPEEVIQQVQTICTRQGLLLSVNR